jgi:hypothetical protein
MPQAEAIARGEYPEIVLEGSGGTVFSEFQLPFSKAKTLIGSPPARLLATKGYLHC